MQLDWTSQSIRLVTLKKRIVKMYSEQYDKYVEVKDALGSGHVQPISNELAADWQS